MRSWEEVFKQLKKHEEWEKLKPYLSPYSPNNPPTLEDVWDVMDQVWEDMDLDNRKYTEENLSRYYSHPVWFFNGLFIETHEQSMAHRRSLATYFKDEKGLKILDYGGGFGTLAKIIADASPSSNIDIYEPHASDYAHENVEGYSGVKIVDSLEGKEEYYDALVNTDVLEHVEDPIDLVAKWNKLLKEEGKLISHWHFKPSIKCHLPKHFHYRYTFARWIVPSLGFSSEIQNDKHGHCFRKERETTEDDLVRANRLSLVSKVIYPLANLLSSLKASVGKVLKITGIYPIIKRNSRRSN